MLERVGNVSVVSTEFVNCSCSVSEQRAVLE